MGIPMNASWPDVAVQPPEGRTFRRVIQPNPAVAVLPLIAGILLLPGLISFTGRLMGTPLRTETLTVWWNLALAVIAGIVLLYYRALNASATYAGKLRLTVDANGLGESGSARGEQDWRLLWTQVQLVELAGQGSDRVLRVYTAESGDRPAHLLFDYPFDELIPTLNTYLAPLGKRCQMGE